jgi:hypothetical protein
MSSLKIALWMLLFALALPAQEPLVRQINLAEMTDSAGTIVHARILDLRFEPHPNYPNINTLKVTAEVLENIRGASARRITFREFAGRAQVIGKRVHNLQSSYRVGQEIVIFLYPPSKAGFTSPVGGPQGKFEVIRQGDQVRVSNGAGNLGLLHGVQQAAQAKGVVLRGEQQRTLKQEPSQLSLADLLGITRQLAAKGRSR